MGVHVRFDRRSDIRARPGIPDPAYQPAPRECTRTRCRRVNRKNGRRSAPSQGHQLPALFVNPADRERLKKLLQDHGSVADFEYEIRRKDGEVRTMLESSIAIRDAAGNLTALQGFLLDITDRKRAEQEIRRRNRELMVLNSIGQTLTASLDLN